jgi:hypothetical protein
MVLYLIVFILIAMWFSRYQRGRKQGYRNKPLTHMIQNGIRVDARQVGSAVNFGFDNQIGLSDRQLLAIS